MPEEEENCQLEDNCSNGTCAPVSPFSREGLFFLAFLVALVAILFYLLNLTGNI